MCNFHVGQKVVCVRDFEPHIRAEAAEDGTNLPQLNQIYTIRALGHFEFPFEFSVVFLEEVVNKPMFYFDILDVVEQGFDPDRFRPVVERKTDISQFQRMLTDTKTQVLA